MANEEEIKQKIAAQFPALTDAITIKRERRIFVAVPYPLFRQVFDSAVKNMDFSSLCAITGLDEGENLCFIYHLARSDGIVLNLRTFVPKADPKLNTVSDYFPHAVIYEKEAIDLFGAEVLGLPEGSFRYPLPDGWPAGQYPLRKDWKPETLDSTDKAKGN